ncbi:MAG TPA: lytic transglycosylase domain-containing protein [Acidimicrobiales bacterium]|nr:lytic transglycosylase domain-containing protein [Acidimicrobiales bacterium]
MRHRLAIALAALVAAGAAAGCSAGGGTEPSNAAAVSSTTVASTSTTTALPTTTTAPTTSTAPGTAVTVAGDSDPDSLAATITAGETAIRDARVPPAALEAQAQAQQLAYRRLAAHPEWLAAVLAKVPASLRDTVRANVHASTELRAIPGKPPTQLPKWHIVAPAPADELLRYYHEAAATTGTPWNVLAAVHLVESRMGRIRGDSTAGAQGPMQFLPSTWAQYGAGGDIQSNHDAILAAGRYLARNGAPANVSNALYAYNHSQHYVAAILDYAGQMAANQRAFYGYYHWQVYYRMPDGDRLLPVGWSN